MVQRVKGWFQGVINFILRRPTSNQLFQLSTFVEYLMRGSLKAATIYTSSTNMKNKQQKDLIERLLIECRKHQICQFEQAPSQYQKLFYLLLSKQYVAAQGLVSELGISQRSNWFSLINKFKHLEEVDGDRILQFLRNLTSLKEQKWEQQMRRESHYFNKETWSVLCQLIEKKALMDCQKRYQLDQKREVKKECSKMVMSLLKVLSELNFNSDEVIYRQIKDEQTREYLKKIGSHLQCLKYIEEDLEAIKMHLQDQSGIQSNEESAFFKTGTNMISSVFRNISFIKDSLLGSPKSLNKLHCGKAVLIPPEYQERRVNFDTILKKKLQDRLALHSKEHDVDAVTNLDKYEEFLKKMISKEMQANHKIQSEILSESFTKRIEQAEADMEKKIKKEKETATEQISRLMADLGRAECALKSKQGQLVLEKAQLATLFSLVNTKFSQKNIKSVEEFEKLLENIVIVLKKQKTENEQLKRDLEKANQPFEKVLLKDNSQEIQALNLQVEQLRTQNDKTFLILREERQEKFQLNCSIKSLSCENVKLKEKIDQSKQQSEESRQSYSSQSQQLKSDLRFLKLELATLNSVKQDTEKERDQQTARMGRVRVQIEKIKGNLLEIKREKQSISQLQEQNRQVMLILSSEKTLLAFNELFRRFLHQIRAKINIIKNCQAEVQMAIKFQQESLSQHISLMPIQLAHGIESYARTQIEDQRGMDELQRVNRSLIEQMNHDYRSYFNADILFENKNTYKTFLVQILQTNVDCRILSTRLLYKYDKLNKNSFHIYVDNIPRLLLLIETEENQLISVYLQNALTPEHTDGCTLLMSLNEWSCFQLKPDKRAIVYNEFYFILGNTDLRVKVEDRSVYSNLGIPSTSFFETGGKNYQDLLGKGRKSQREATFRSIEFYQVNFMPQNGNM